MSMEDFDRAANDLVADLEESGVIDDLDRTHRATLEADTEWARQVPTHLGSIMAAWSHGVITSNEYYHGYALPDHFDVVFAHISRRLCEKFPADEAFMGAVVDISLCEMRQWLKEWAMELPEFRAWNDLPGSGVTSRYHATGDTPSFIDLDVPSHNAAVYLQNQRREERAFEIYMARKYPPGCPEEGSVPE